MVTLRQGAIPVPSEIRQAGWEWTLKFQELKNFDRKRTDLVILTELGVLREQFDGRVVRHYAAIGVKVVVRWKEGRS